MELTGQCKIEFEEWLLDYLEEQGFCKASSKMSALSFENDIPSRKWGVYQDFFLHNGVAIEPCFDDSDKPVDMSIYSGFGVKQVWEMSFKTLDEARIQAIKKANEIYNQTK